MPIHEYECVGCRNKFEHLQRRTGDAPAQCPRCGNRKLKKVLSGFSVAAAAGGHRHEPSAACASCPRSGCPHSGR